MEKGLLSIGEFSRLSGIGRKTLIFYDREGVFSPQTVGRGRYRYYSQRQLQATNVIVALRAIGVSLDEIKTFMRVRTPDRLAELCGRQERRIEAEIGKLKTIREIIQSLNASTGSAAVADTRTIEVRELPACRLFVGPEMDAGDMDAIDNALAAFYELCAEKGVPVIHPLGSTTRLDKKHGAQSFPPSRFYCPAGSAVPKSLTIIRPGGRYAVGYAYGDYGRLDGLYRKILRYVRKHGHEIMGDAYEEYLLSEMALSDPDSYLARVAVRVG